MDAKPYIAHQRQTDQQKQPLATHLSETGALAAMYAAKIDLAASGKILGLLHDFGKYSRAFQDYIRSATGDYDRDDAGWVDTKALKGKIDHSTAGAQYLWDKLSGIGKSKLGQGELCAKILALCIASHHSGLIDCLDADGNNLFERRIEKADEQTHKTEAIQAAADFLAEQIEPLLGVDFVKTFSQRLRQLPQFGNFDTPPSIVTTFQLGMLTRFLFSCLVDADRTNSAEFEDPARQTTRLAQQHYFAWATPLQRLETKLAGLTGDTPVNQIRQQISNACLKRAKDSQGIYTLTVPTGGGKTLASLRYALHHAQQHQLDRIIYIIPYTSIIEQNAAAVRATLEQPDDLFPWILEQHGSLEPEQQNWHSKLVTENWDAPIVFTTMVQFLEALFAGGTSRVRRLHQLANAVLIFDEIQTLPIKCVHLFCNALNFLTQQAGSTALLCTATQPLLDKLHHAEYGQLTLADNPEIMPKLDQLFSDLQRVKIHNQIQPGGWEPAAIVELIQQRFAEQQSCLVIVNTKAWAKDLYNHCKEWLIELDALFHLSTHQCAAQRKQLLQQIRARLANKQPVLCISTQLIEAGVDISFANVIRFLAGLDSIAQAAGRCNRHGELRDAQGNALQGQVDIINPATESLKMLPDIEEGQEKTKGILQDYPATDLLTPAVMTQYYDRYFFQRRQLMVYPYEEINLLALLSSNNKRDYYRYAKKRQGKFPLLLQSFMTAGKAFQVIDAPTRSIIVPYGEGKQIITELCSINLEYNAAGFYHWLKKAQNYSVNVFPHQWDQLKQLDAIYEVQPDTGIYYLGERYYSEQFGLSGNVVAGLATMMQ